MNEPVYAQLFSAASDDAAVALRAAHSVNACKKQRRAVDTSAATLPVRDDDDGDEPEMEPAAVRRFHERTRRELQPREIQPSHR